MTDTWSASATYSYSRARRDDNLGEGEYLIGHREHGERNGFSVIAVAASGSAS